MDEKLWKMILLLQRFKVGRSVVGLLYDFGIITVYHHFALEYERKHPTIQMKEAKKFFFGEDCGGAKQKTHQEMHICFK